MNVLFLGGDKRYIGIIDNFINRGYDVDLIGFSKLETKANKLEKLELKKYNFIILPMSGISKDYTVKSLDGIIKIDKETFNQISNTIVFTGLITDPILDIDNRISFLEDKNIKEKNDNLTVNGIIEDIKLRNPNIICLLGYGNIGKKLYEKLKNYSVFVGVNEYDDYQKLKYHSFYTYDKEYFGIILKNSDVIINTVPKNIIDEELSKNIKGYFLEIASSPYGIKQELTKDINYKLYSNIPANYNPEEAGKILLKKINKMIGGKI